MFSFREITLIIFPTVIFTIDSTTITTRSRLTRQMSVGRNEAGELDVPVFRRLRMGHDDRTLEMPKCTNFRLARCQLITR